MQTDERLNKSNSAKIIISKITSGLGNSVFDYANQMIISKLFPTTPFFLGVYQSAEQIVGIVFNLFAGAFADNNERKKMLIYTDFFSGLVCLLGMLFLNSELVYFALVAGNILLAILHAYNSPLYNAIVKDSISESYVEKHISIATTCSELISVVAPVVGLFIWKFFGIYFAYAFNAITFFFSAFVSKSIQCKEQKPEEKIRDKANTFIQIKEGIVYISKNKIILNLLLVSAGVNFFLSAYNILLPYLTEHYTGEVDNFFGLALIANSAGAIIFSIINTKFSDKFKLTSHVRMVLSLFMVGVSILTIPIVEPYIGIYFKLIPYFLMGGFLTLFNIQFFSIVQKKTDSEYIGRVYSVIFTIAILLMPLGNIIFGSILSASDLIGMGISGAGIVFVVIFYILISKGQFMED